MSEKKTAVEYKKLLDLILDTMVFNEEHLTVIRYLLCLGGCSPDIISSLGFYEKDVKQAIEMNKSHPIRTDGHIVHLTLNDDENWLVKVGYSCIDSEGNEAQAWRVRGTREDVKKYLCTLAASYQKEYQDGYDGDRSMFGVPESPEEIGEIGDALYCTPFTEDFDMDITASPEAPPIDIREDAVPQKNEEQLGGEKI